ncbi:MAG: hypothetical protein M0Q14_04285 [Tissierellaceae bacterium]|nr:hypothetical protein [Tissierellaceae bacterium]
MLTLSHWIYILVVLSVIVAMIFRRDVVLVCLVGTFLIGVIYTGSVVSGIQTVFHALMTGGIEIFDIMLIIAIMVAMLKSLEVMGADKTMLSPFRKLMKTPTITFFILGIAMYIASLFFWPTPATALIGAVLIPVAVEAGLPALYAAMAVNIFGHGMALSGDLILQGAPQLAAKSADIDIAQVLSRGALLSIIAGVVSIIITFIMLKNNLRKENIKVSSGRKSKDISAKEINNPMAKLFGRVVPVVLLAVIVVMVMRKIKGGDATALLGGTGTAILIVSTISRERNKALEKIVEHLREGFTFAIKIFSPVIPIAGFFFLGGSESAMILGENAPKLLFDIGETVAKILPLNKISLGFGNMIIGIITGLDGSGFSGVPLVGGLARALGGPVNVNIPTLAAIGQVSAVWSGGGTIVAWCFGLVATAGIAGVSPLDLARKNFIPVMGGLLVSTIVGIFLM